MNVLQLPLPTPPIAERSSVLKIKSMKEIRKDKMCRTNQTHHISFGLCGHKPIV